MKMHQDIYSEHNAKNAVWLAKLINEQGVQLRKFSDDVADAWGVAAQEVFAEVREHSPLARRIDDSYRSALKSTAAWLKIADGEYAIQRNRVLGI